MRVVLDTNVIIAAFATQGICHALFEACLDQHRIFLNTYILAEVEEKLQTKLKLPEGATTAIMGYLREHAELVEHGRPPKQICRDADDDWVLGLAEAAQADYVITGDQDLLLLGSYGVIPIVTPRQFWEVLRGQSIDPGTGGT